MAETPTMEVRARLSAETANFTRGFAQASQSVEGFQKSSSRLNSTMVAAGVVAGTVGASLIAFGVKSFSAAARVDELNYALAAIGKSTGKGEEALVNEAKEVKGMGIEMEIAQKSVLKFAQNNLELGKASDLARIAQDLAIISGENSTDTFNKLTHAVITGRSEVLKSVGIQESAGAMYEKFARSIGVSTKSLSAQQKQQAVMEGVMREGVKVFGTYEAAMKSPGKTLRSFARLHNELQVAMGNVLLNAFGPIILAVYDLEKAFTKAVETNETFKAVFDALEMVFTKLIEPVVNVVKKITDFIKGLSVVSKTADDARNGIKKIIPDTKGLAEKFEMLLPVLASVTAGLAAFAGRGLLSNLPILGKFMGALKVFPVMMVVLALTSTQVRSALVNLFTAFKPLLPIVIAIGKALATYSVVGVAVLAKAINILAGVVRTVIGFFQRNIETVKKVGIAFALTAIAIGTYKAVVITTTAITAAFTFVMGLLRTATKLSSAAMFLFNAALGLNPIALVIALIVALVAAFTYLMVTNEDFANNAKEVFNFVGKLILKVFAGIVIAVGYLIKGFAYLMKFLGFFIELAVTIFEFFIDTFLYAVIGIIEGIKFLLNVFAFLAEVTVNVFEFVVDVILSVVIAIVKGIQFLIDGFVSLMESNETLRMVFENVFNGIIRIVGFIIQGILNTFARLVGGVADLVGVFNNLFKGIKSIFFSILDAISGVGNGIFKVLENVAKGIGKFLGDVFDATTSWIRTLLNLFSKIPGIGPMVANALNAGLDATKDAITGIASLGVDLGKSAFNGIVNGIKTTVNAVSNIGTTTQKTLEGVEKTLDNFKSKVQQFTDKDNGAAIVAGLIKGAKGASSALDAIVGKLEEVKKFDMNASLVTGPIKDMVAGLDATIAALQKTIDFDMAGGVKSVVDGLIKKVEGAAEFVIGLGSSINDLAEKDIDFAGNIIDGIGGLVNKIKDSFKEGLGFGDIVEKEKKKFEDAGGKVEDPFTKTAEDLGKQSDSIKAIRDAMAKGIEGIQDIIADLGTAMKDMADSLKDTIIGFAGLKGVELPDGFIPKAKSLIDNMRLKLNKSEQFAQQIAQLQAMNLDAGALKAIIEEGPVKGAQLAASILGGGQQAVNDVSQLQKAIELAGAGIGDFGSKISYEGQIAAAKAKLGKFTGNTLVTGATDGGGNVFVQDGSIRITIDASKASNQEETAEVVTRELERFFKTLGRELAAKS